MSESIVYIKDVLSANSQTWFPATRSGTTAVGHTLETSVFQKKEDNLKNADIGDTELKSTLGRGSIRVRLGTKSCGAEKHLFNQYGKLNKLGTSMTFYPLFKIGAAKSLTGTGGAPNTTANIVHDHDRLSLRLSHDGEIGHWKLDDIAHMIMVKLKNVAVVEAEKKIINDVTHFRYHAATFFTGLCVPRIIAGLTDGLIKMEFRVSEGHDHGTSFNTTTTAMKKSIYQNCERVVF